MNVLKNLKKSKFFIDFFSYMEYNINYKPNIF